MEAALLEAVTERAPLLRVLAGRMPAATKLLERELQRLGRVELETVEPDLGLCERLPRGMCERLLAVPVGTNRASGVVELAVADPFDAHPKEEFAYHLGTPVRTCQAPLGELLAQLETLSYESSEERTPAFGTRPARSDRLASAGRLGRAEPRPTPDRGSSEPPIPLVRRSSLPAPIPVEIADRLESLLVEMESATSPADITRLLARGLGAVAHKVAVFSMRGRLLQGRIASSSIGGDQAVEQLELDPATGGVLAHALEVGHYLGPLPGTGADAALQAFLAVGKEEVYVSRVDVSGRPALVFILGAMSNAFLASQRADRLGRGARAALERILVAKKSRAPRDAG